MGVDSSSLVRLIDILSRQGLGERRVDTADVRARVVHLTAAGQQRVAEIRRELAKREAEMLAEFSDTEIAVMLAQFEWLDQRLRSCARR